MTRLDQVFRNLPVVLPVIHVESLDQALRNAQIARQAGCDGVFLINHAGPYSELLAIHRAVFSEHPDCWIGVNCLDLSPRDVFEQISDEVAGVWVDNAGIDETAERQWSAEEASQARRDSGWQGLYFGGVAFKYQRQVDNLERAALLATNYVDVVTTSGSGTGRSVHVDKIRTMKGAIGSFPLAIASGVTPENVSQYLGVSDCFLVATGISRSWTELDPERTASLVSRVRRA